MRCPSVDVVIPVHNGERFIAEAIESALRQYLPPRRVLVVDDGSSDGTLGIIESFGPAVQILRHDTNRGLPAARNTGIAHSEADLVAFLDADDLWTADKLQKQLPIFERDDGIGLCYTGTVACDSGSTPIGKAKLPRARHSEWVFEELYRDGFPMAPSTVIVRREAFDRCGMFDESMLKAQDFECWLRIAMLYPVSCVSEALCLRRVNPESITNTAGVDKDIYYVTRAFDLCAAAAVRHNIRLPLPVEDRKRVFLKRRYYECLNGGRLEAASEYLRSWQEFGEVSLRERIKAWAAWKHARAMASVRRWIKRQTERG